MALVLDDSLFRTIVENFTEGILLADDHGVIAWLNPAVGHLFGYPPAELLGLAVEVLVPEEHRTVHALHREVYTLSPSRRPMGTALRLTGRRKNGSVFPVDVSLTPVVLDGRQMTIAEVRDRTALEAAHEALRRALEGRAARG